jgi:hypothetical protein
VNSVIDPQVKSPGIGLPTSANGQRYLLVNEIPDQTGGADAWVGLTGGALPNDIIQYNGTSWSVVFDSTTVKTIEFVTNLTTQLQYRWANSTWTKSYEGFYTDGDWNIVI